VTAVTDSIDLEARRNTGYTFVGLPASHHRCDSVGLLGSLGVPHERLRSLKSATAVRRWGRRYPDAGYGGTFIRWLIDPEMGAYGSWGNGAAMRVAPIGWAFDDEATVLAEAARSAMPTHDHAEGVKGAQAVALAVFMARRRVDRWTMRQELETRFGYDLDRRVDAVRPEYRFDVSCQGSVPEALLAFFESSGVEDAVRLAVSLGGDADTQAAIAGAVAEAWYGGLPPGLEAQVLGRLDEAMRDVIGRFRARFMPAPVSSAPRSAGLYSGGRRSPARTGPRRGRATPRVRTGCVARGDRCDR
jgi:ADP-ribosylglycohydrolase